MTRADNRMAYLKMKSVLYDRVTGLPSFPLAFDRLRSWLDDRKVIGVLHLEIAEVEMVESLYGWQVFDGVVAHASRALREALGVELPADSFVALNGVAGHRFVVFVPEAARGVECAPAYLEQLAQALARRIERAFDADEFAGLSPAPCVRAGHALLSENTFFRFERCVYAAVAEAREAHGRRERGRERSWGEELREVIRSGSVHCVFQPVVELETRNVLGHEALARGPRDTLFESPRAMFALSDRLGVADELDRLCCDSALASAAELGQPGKLFVNLRATKPAAGQAAVDALRSAVERHGLQPSDLVLEISERSGEVESDGLAEQLRALSSEGFAVALDNIGTGRTRLDTIRRIEPDYLKIDATLVRNLQASLMQQEVVATLVELAESIGSEVIGEGVETDIEASTLLAGGARYAQGHLFAAPAAARTLRAAAGRLQRPGH